MVDDAADAKSSPFGSAPWQLVHSEIRDPWLAKVLDPDRYSPERLAAVDRGELTKMLARHREFLPFLTPTWAHLESRWLAEIDAMERELTARTSRS